MIFPSGMMTRHLESSLAARPASVGGDIAPAEDTRAMLESNPGFSRDVSTPEDAARGVVEEVLAGEPYIVTHGDLVAPVLEHLSLIRRAVERASRRGQAG